jgi:pimeloyl-ACP methyl ester carboxylesterase
VSDQVMDALVRLSQAEDGLIGQVGWIECPTLVVTGELDPAAPPADAADLVAAIGRNAQLCVIAGAGHGVYRDQPAVFNEVVRTFLRGIAASLATP